MEREKKKKVRRNLIDPLAWTFEDPWNSGYLRSTSNVVSGDSLEVEILQVNTPALDTSSNYQNQLISVIPELDELETALPSTGWGETFL